jgi:phospholipase/carboxylesterase
MTDQAAPPTAPPASLHVLSIRTNAPTSLVVLLHGVGADADSFHDVARALAPSFPASDFVTPDGFEPFDSPGAMGGRQWFSLDGVTEENRGARVRASGASVSSWIDRQLDERKLAHDRLVVIGFSQGAMVAGWLAVHRRPTPAAVVMFSGRVADDAAPVAGSVETPVLIAHGTADPRIPVTAVDPGAKALEAWGARVTKKIYPGLGHTIDGAELRDATAFLKGVLGDR